MRGSSPAGGPQRRGSWPGFPAATQSRAHVLGEPKASGQPSEKSPDGGREGAVRAWVLSVCLRCLPLLRGCSPLTQGHGIGQECEWLPEVPAAPADAPCPGPSCSPPGLLAAGGRLPYLPLQPRLGSLWLQLPLSLQLEVSPHLPPAGARAQLAALQVLPVGGSQLQGTLLPRLSVGVSRTQTACTHTQHTRVLRTQGNGW